MDGLQVLELNGELDLSQKAKIESDLDEIDVGGRTAVTILDLSHVRYVDTTFINALFRARRRLARTSAHHRLVLVAPRTNILWRLYEIIGLSGVFPIYETVALARRSEDALLASPASE